MDEFRKMSVDILIRQVRNGNSSAFDELFNRYQSMIYSFSLRYLKSEVEAEGVVQEVFIYIWEHRSSLRSDTNIKSYFFQISYNLIRKVFRKQAYQNKYLNEKACESLITDNSTLDDIEYQSTIQEVLRIVDRLSPRKREIFKLSRIGGLTNKEISTKLNISRATVDNQISDILKYIRKRLSHVEYLIFLLLFQ
ncbi:MAG: RNA polymerase sigma-70 factor [Carboxylicivirga sp.]|jgi:RNA polymerase sigma-70 factor (ECF subfamily)|nr:RNA polymerase sigma-70 factor [Carboxylicivirga sp.]